MPTKTQTNPTSYEKSLVTFYKSIKTAEGVASARKILLGAKGSLLGVSSLTPQERAEMLQAYRKAEQEVFGEIESLPGETELLKQS